MNQRQLIPLVDRWHRRLLPDWSIEISYERLQDDDGDAVQGKCNALWQYKSAQIRLNPYEITAADAEETVVHEFVHALLNPLTHSSDEIMEHVTTAITKAFLRAYHVDTE